MVSSIENRVRADILRLWAGTGGEGAKFWMSVLTDLRNRGVKDVYLARECGTAVRQCAVNGAATPHSLDGIAAAHHSQAARLKAVVDYRGRMTAIDTERSLREPDHLQREPHLTPAFTWLIAGPEVDTSSPNSPPGCR